MSHNSAYAGPKLPKTLLDQVQDGRIGKDRREPSRKLRRQNERSLKKQQHQQRNTSRNVVASKPNANNVSRPNARQSQETSARRDDQIRKTPAVKSVTSKTSRHHYEARDVSELSDGEKEDEDIDVDLNEEDSDDAEEQDNALDEDDDEDEDEDEDKGMTSSRPNGRMSASARARLEEDDAEIARLEKKLGIKKSSKTVRDDELDWLVNGSDSEDGDLEPLAKRKRSSGDDEWLQSKRQKAKVGSQVKEAKNTPASSEEEDEGLDGMDESDSETLENSDHFSGFSEDDDEYVSADEQPIAAPPRVRENPYVAPLTNDNQPTKYVPPSLRRASASDTEALRQLQRQLQGLLNRLSEANILAILQSIEQIYANNARQHVTATLIELLGTRTADVAVLNDTFLILHAAFATSVYRVIGPDFIAQLLEDLVRRFDDASAREEGGQTGGKQSLNILAFMSNLYVFQAIGCEIIFDHIRLLLDNFCEANTELLLRIIRTCGPQLRQDDPSALKDIVLLLQRSIAKAGGESKVSVRTKFMVETIMDLKNNRMKHGLGASAMAAEHVTTMKKILGTLSANSRNAKNTEPLSIGLNDIRDSDKKGKWWLVGASWRDPAKMADARKQAQEQPVVAKAEIDTFSDDETAVDLSALARAQGMNTDVRRAIFYALLDSVSYQHAHERILKLNLKSKQMLEVPRVILRCAAAETSYNHFYTLVASEFCKEHRLRKAWEFSLLDTFRRMGEDRDDEYPSDDDDADDDEKLSVRETYNLAKLYGALVAEGLLRVTILKTLNLSSPKGLQPTTTVFVQVLVTTVLLALKSASKKSSSDAVSQEKGETAFEAEVKSTFAHAHFLPDLPVALRYFLARSMTKTDIASSTKNKKERKAVMIGLGYALEALKEQAAGANELMTSDDEDYSRDDI
jgi:nucleolar MIF4G domain-containing protein 1